jgi:hypothetical protein
VILNPAQESMLTRIRTAKGVERNAERDALDRAREIAEKEVTAYVLATDLEVRQAFEAKIPAARIGSALGTKDAKTVTDSLARTAKLHDVRQAEEQAADPTLDPRFSIDPEGILLVALVGDDLLKACEYEDWTVADATAAGVTTATFDISREFPRPIEERFVFTHSLKHPIIVWANRHEAEMVTWYRARLARLAESS